MSERRRIVSAENAPDFAAWTLPAVVGPLVPRRRDEPPPAKPVESGRAEGYEEGYARGLEEGRAAGHAAGFDFGREAGQSAGRADLAAAFDTATAATARLESVFEFLAAPLAELDAEVERELVTLALAIAKQLVRRELRADPAQIIAIIRETVALLPAAARTVRVHLHPEDAGVVRERLATPAAERAWSIVEDPVLARGGCRVTTDISSIDVRLESRIAAVAAALLGEERAPGREPAGLADTDADADADTDTDTDTDAAEVSAAADGAGQGEEPTEATPGAESEPR